MKLLPRPLQLAGLALILSGSAYAADALKADTPKSDAPTADAAKDGAAPASAAPPVPERPSRPYPKNASPKAFAPKAADPVAAKEAARPAPADKVAEPAPAQPDKHAGAHDKSAATAPTAPLEKTADKASDRPAEAASRRLRRAPRPRGQTAAPAARQLNDPALAAVVQDYLRHGAPGGVYRAKAGENLDAVIRNSMPDSPFSLAVMHAAFARANPQLPANPKTGSLKPGAPVTLPDAAVFRQVLLGTMAPPEPYTPAPAAGSDSMITVTPGMAPGGLSGVTPLAAGGAQAQRVLIAVPPPRLDTGAIGPAQSVSPDEKRQWIHFP